MKMILFHGSNHIIKKPQINLGKINNDFGRGFYCTQDLELAKEWAKKNDEPGYVNKYEIDISKLKTFDLREQRYSTLKWIALLLKNRTFDKTQTSEAISEKITQLFSVDLSGYDIVIGYRADDSYFSFAQSFLSNALSFNELSGVLKIGNLGTQVVLLSEKAFESIKFVGSEMVDDIYYSRFITRDANARLDYKAFVKHKQIKKDDLFAIDIIREGFDLNDPRIQ